MHGDYKMEKKWMIVPDIMLIFRSMKRLDKYSKTDIHFDTRITYAYINLLFKVMLEKKWIFVARRDGLRIIYQLTPDGKEIADAIDMLFKKMGVDDHLNDFRKKGWVKKKEHSFELGENG